MTVFWSSPTTTILGGGEVSRYDPLVGPDRYRRSSEWLTSTGRAVGLASFSFDPSRPGSVVVAPEFTTPALPAGGPTPQGRIVEDGRVDWEFGFRAALRELGAGAIQKVVLARQVEVEFDAPVVLDPVLNRLVSANPDTYVFAIDGMIGACPELLVSVDGETVTSLVLAGTARTAEGLENDRISEEHRYAADSAATALKGLTVDLIGEQSVLTFGHINHVGTRFIGRRRSGVGVLDVVAALHPTAAVGGTPGPAAVELIGRIESRPRGRYAGPIGWFDADGNGEFSLALRCGLVRPDRVTLYAGGGLVASAQRDLEWDETQLKLGPMLRALGIRTAGQA